MGYFRNIINKFNETNLKLGEVAIAGELDSHAECTWSDEDFEIVCDYLYDYYISSEISAQELVNLFIIAYQNSEFTTEDVANFDKKVDEAIYRLM